MFWTCCLRTKVARIIACAQACSVASLDETWENTSQGLMTTWEKCCHCSEPVQGCQAACKHRLLMCPQACVFAGDDRWQAFVEVAGEANPAASMRKLDVQAMSPEEQVAWLSRILAPAVMTTSGAKACWSTLARALMPEEEALTAMQVAEVDILEQEPHADLGGGEDCIATTERHAKLGGGKCPSPLTRRTLFRAAARTSSPQLWSLSRPRTSAPRVKHTRVLSRRA